MKAEPGWYVRITLPHGEQIHIDEFVTETEARSWINDKSVSWLKNTAEADMSKRCSHLAAFAGLVLPASRRANRPGVSMCAKSIVGEFKHGEIESGRIGGGNRLRIRLL